VGLLVAWVKLRLRIPGLQLAYCRNRAHTPFGACVSSSTAASWFPKCPPCWPLWQAERVLVAYYGAMRRAEERVAARLV
jgi:hypothetical protein